MRWEDERYVRVYTRDTVDWQSLSFDAQALLVLLLRKVDRAGLLPLGKHGKRGAAIAIGHPHEWPRLESALDELLADGCVQLTADGQRLLVPNFLEAQEARASDKARQAKARELARLMAESVTACDSASRTVTETHTTSHDVTSGHAASHDVTPSRAVPCRAEPSHAVSLGASAPDAGEDLPNATDDAVEVPERPALELLPSPPDAPEKPASKPPASAKAKRKPSPGVALYERMETARADHWREYTAAHPETFPECVADPEEGWRKSFVPEGVPPARIESLFGDMARRDAAGQERLELAFGEYLSDPDGVKRTPPWSLRWFVHCLSTYETRVAVPGRAGGAP